MKRILSFFIAATLLACTTAEVSASQLDGINPEEEKAHEVSASQSGLLLTNTTDQSIALTIFYLGRKGFHQIQTGIRAKDTCNCSRFSSDDVLSLKLNETQHGLYNSLFFPKDARYAIHLDQDGQPYLE